MTAGTRSQNFEMPTADMDLAEWANRIKAIQRQVDADEEVEQRRLEEEIAASRTARPRHNHGGTDHGENGGWVDHQPGNGPQSYPTAGRPLPSAKQFPITSTPSATKPTQQARSEPVSLASFIGGRATGPRLNKHAPQQDISDPTQFDHYIRSDAPHPIFGRGGVGMPGMVSRPKEPPLASTSSITETRTVGVPARGEVPNVRERRTSTPAIARRYLESLENKADAIKRERTLSKPTTPTAPTSVIPVVGMTSNSISPPIHEHETSQSKGPSQSPLLRTTDVLRRDSASVASSSRDKSTATPSKSAVPLPGLARPIAPEPKPTVLGPQLPPSNPSPAFLRPSLQKDPTPSISRLQGRGFVQSMVQISSQLETPASPTEQPQSERNRSASAKRTTPVLERWQPAIVSPSPVPSQSPLRLPPSTPSPSRSPRNPTPLVDRTAYTPNSVSPSPSSKVALPPVRPTISTPPVILPKPSVSVPVSRAESHSTSQPTLPVLRSFSQPSPVESPSTPKRFPPRILPSKSLTNPMPKLGSATTMVVINTPVDTGHLFDGIAELGMRKTAAPEVPRLDDALPSASRPLTHLTKNRAKKPRKARGVVPNTQSKTNNTGVEKAPVEFSSTRELPEVSTLDELIDAPKDKASSRSPMSSVQAPSTNHTTMTSTNTRRPLPQPKPSLPSAPRPIQSITGSSEMSTGATSPMKHPRIPSTGNRPTVMDVAQTFNSPPPSPTRQIEQPPSQPSRTANTSPVSEKRKSNYGKYSSIVMPPLKEEATPESSPANSLNRHGEAVSSKVKVPLPGIFGAKSAGGANGDNLVHLDHVDSPLPTINVMSLLSHPISLASSESESRTISIEILKLSGHSATPVNDGIVFYDTEVLAVIHRAKSQSSGLVATDVWVWQGKRSVYTADEEDKLNELAKRYNTIATTVIQNQEPSLFVHMLGGKLVIRQGTRNHWSAENTALHAVRCINGVIFIDEIDLNIRNLCSAFSYCLTVLGTVYVWHGCGAIDAERQAAIEYAQLLGGGAPVAELIEGQNDGDDMFWMVLGDEGVERADHWRWRRTANTVDPRIWRVDTKLGRDAITPISSIWDNLSPHREVYIIDCIWEYFVLVGADARHKRGDIRLALSAATDISRCVADYRPFPPPVHVIILPSQLPLDLRMSIRDLDEAMLNGNSVPDHMNLVPSTEAMIQLQTHAWAPAVVTDHEMLPVGVSPLQLA